MKERMATAEEAVAMVRADAMAAVMVVVVVAVAVAMETVAAALAMVVAAVTVVVEVGVVACGGIWSCWRKWSTAFQILLQYFWLWLMKASLSASDHRGPLGKSVCEGFVWVGGGWSWRWRGWALGMIAKLVGGRLCMWVGGEGNLDVLVGGEGAAGCIWSWRRQPMLLRMTHSTNINKNMAAGTPYHAHAGPCGPAIDL